MFPPLALVEPPPDFKLNERLLLPYLSAFWRIYAANFYFSVQVLLAAVVWLPKVEELVAVCLGSFVLGGLAMPGRSGV